MMRCPEMIELLVEWIWDGLGCWEGSKGVAVGGVGGRCGRTVVLGGGIRGTERARTIRNGTGHELLRRRRRSCDSTI
jgi:hypothetical protein